MIGQFRMRKNGAEVIEEFQNMDIVRISDNQKSLVWLGKRAGEGGQPGGGG